MTLEAKPLASGQRADILDALRGFALLGILLTHVPSFAGNDFLRPVRAAALDVWDLDHKMSLAVDFFVEGKFVALFSLLFGVGFAIQMRDSATDEESVRKRFIRRLTFLLVIGLAHLFLLWQGDILTYYALLGFGLLSLRRCRARTLAGIAGIFSLLPALVYAAIFAVYRWVPGVLPVGGDAAGVPADYMNRLEAIGDVFSSGTYFETLRANFEYWTIKLQWMLLEGRLFTIFAMFLLGAAFGKSKLHYTIVGNRALLPAFLAMLAVGAVGSAYVVYSRHEHGIYPPSVERWFAAFVAATARPILALSYAVGICLLWSQPRTRALVSIFRWPGRMALTTYLSQTVICVTLFYGYGLGFGGTLGVAQSLLAGAVIFIVQTIGCRLWLTRFQFGPVEWVWRQVTYGRRLPIWIAGPTPTNHVTLDVRRPD